VFGGRIDDHIGPEGERALPQRRGKYIVDHQRGAHAVRDLRDSGDVDDFEHRIGRTFQKKRFGVGADGLLPLIEVGAVNQRGGHAEARQKFFDHPSTGPEQRLGGDHVVTRPELADQGRRYRRHAGCGRASRFGSFERGHAAFEHGDRGVGKARIEIARLFALETGLALLSRFVDKALGEE
jgi:hypothetical protein